MLTVHQIAKSYGVEKVLADVSFSAGAGERVGLVGPNGGGKTTRLRIIAGQERTDNEHVRLGAGVRTGYMAQEQEGLDPALDAPATIRAARAFRKPRPGTFCTTSCLATTMCLRLCARCRLASARG